MRFKKSNQELSHSAYTQHKYSAVSPEKRSKIHNSVGDSARKNILLQKHDSEPNVLDELVNLKSQSMDIRIYNLNIPLFLPQFLGKKEWSILMVMLRIVNCLYHQRLVRTPPLLLKVSLYCTVVMRKRRSLIPKCLIMMFGTNYL